MKTTANPPILHAEASLWKRNAGLYAMFAAAMATLAAGVLFWFDPDRYPFYPLCAFHKLTGLLCPGCGALRALHQLLHGHLTAAFRFNPLLITTLPILALYAAVCSMRTLHGGTLGFAIRSKWWWVLLVVALAFSVWRNIPGSTFSTLPQ